VWSAFTSLNKYCRTGSGFAGLTDVNAANGGNQVDNQESFIFAEVLKYMYLTFAPGT
jgi:mannosyl-oligosaccharide alpha-1,2-mannosidase